ncbi:MAG: inositol monophosphatase family protein [Cyanobacteria bacterium J06641_5]
MGETVATHDIFAAVAREAGDRLLAIQKKPEVIARQASGDLTLVADRQSQELIRARLETALPGLAIVVEEDGQPQELPATFLTVDPLDGTLPYALGCPDWGVNLGYVENGRPVSGTIYLPATQQLLQVSAARGCTLNGKPITPQQAPPDARFVLGLDLHYATDPEFIRAVLVPLIPKLRLTRSLGSTTALTVDFALGRTDAHLNLRGGGVWDIVTLGAVVAARGGTIVDLAGQPRNWRDRTTALVASCYPWITEEILQLTRAFAGDLKSDSEPGPAQR